MYCAGQVAIGENGVPSSADMRSQLIQAIRNLEELIREAGYECSGIVRLYVYTTSNAEFFATCMDIYGNFIARHGLQQATSLLEIKGLFAALTIELEETDVK